MKLCRCGSSSIRTVPAVRSAAPGA
jgi:hypothetical protein